MLAPPFPIIAFRLGELPRDAATLADILKTRGAAWYGDPKGDLLAAAQQTAAPASRWFVVGLDRRDRAVAAVFYRVASARIPSIHVTSVAAAVASAIRPAVGATLVDAVVSRFAGVTGGRGYVVTDVGRDKPDVIAVLQGTGWHGLSPPDGDRPVRLARFLGASPAADN